MQVLSNASNTPALSPALRGAAALLGELMLEGDRLGAAPVRDTEGLAELFENMSDDDAAAAHFSTFAEGVFPYASVFLTEEAQCGGDVAQWADDRWALLGDRPAPQVTADHLGLQLQLLARLPDDDALVLIERYLLSWLPAFAAAVPAGPWAEVVGLVQALVNEGALALRSAQPAAQALRVAADPLPEPPALLDDEKTSLKEIGRFLLRPAWTGAFFSRQDLVALGRATETPSGFGPRVHVFENLLASAAEYGDVGALLQAAADHIQRQAGALTDDESGNRWRARAAQTVTMLAAMKAQADTLSTEGLGEEPLPEA